MDKSNPLLNLFSDMSINIISNYVEKITDLYLKPISVWRKILSPEKISINVFIFYLLFYSLIIYIFSPDIFFVAKFISLQLIVNLQPFLILLLPFIFFTIIWKRKIKINRLFRIIFTFWLQIFPFIFIPITIAEKYGVESPYILSDNAMVILDSMLTCIVPLMITLSWWKKLIWIITNYIVLNLFIIFSISTYGYFPDIDKIRSEVESKAPRDEFYSFEYKYKDSDLYLSDQYYIFYYKPTDYKVFSTQYATYFLLDTIIENNKKIVSRVDTKLDKLFKEGDTSRAYIKKNENKGFNNFDMHLKIKLDKDELISRNMLNQYRERYNKMFYHDLKLTDSLKSFAKFEGNRELFNQFHKLLSTYEKIYTDTSFVKSIVKTMKKGDYDDLYVDDGSKLVLVDMSKYKNNKVIIDIKKEVAKKYDKILKRFEMSTVCHRYFYFITYKIFEKKKKPLKEQFKNIY